MTTTHRSVDRDAIVGDDSKPRKFPVVRAVRLENVDDIVTPIDKPIGNDTSVTPPVDCLGAHVRRGVIRSKFDELIERIIGIRPEGLIVLADIRGVKKIT